MTRGTKTKTPAELEAAIQRLGANLNVSAGTEAIYVSGNTLARNYPAVVALLTEILLEPRWDAEELEILRRETLSDLEQQSASPNAIAEAEWRKLMYGPDNIRAFNQQGTKASVPAITMDDLKAFYAANISPSVAKLHVVGALSESEVTGPLADLVKRWTPKAVTVKQWPLPTPPTTAKVYFYDVPGAKQSVLRIGTPSLAVTNPDYYPATVMNYILGGGSFASRLTQELREGKGYTYGIRSGFSGSKEVGEFQIGSGVRSNVTLESTQAIKDILEAYPETFSEADLETTRGFLTKSSARAFETAGAKLNMLENMSEYNWDANYVKEREAIVAGMSQQKIKQLAEQYLKPGEMIWLVVGDAATQLERMTELGYGEAVLLN
jgi:zinc protease